MLFRRFELQAHKEFVKWVPENLHFNSLLLGMYRQVSDISCTKYQHLKDSLTVLRLSLPNTLKPDIESRMKM